MKKELHIISVCINIDYLYTGLTYPGRKMLLYPFSNRPNFLWIISFHWHRQHTKDNYIFLMKFLFLRNIVCPSPCGVVMYRWSIMGSQWWELPKTQYVSRKPETKKSSKNLQSLFFVTYSSFSSLCYLVHVPTSLGQVYLFDFSNRHREKMMST